MSKINQNSFSLPDDIRINYTYFLSGSKLNKEGQLENLLAEKESRFVCAKKAESLNLNKTSYYIKSRNGKYVNPYSADFNLMKDRDCRWVKVSEEAFKLYTEFLIMGKDRLLFQAERLL